ncbi:hypothetical protein J4N45_10045 [Vibrio sp. SCSIO 43140]|uniref:hypothetical protein n=1 Tax=Vibrio sp. SCSIO 43140 TaxID=2819100 RepID=UPI002074B6B8|nr:hypothetical protein [Vibrio sp. SCSIO 43140]USD58870.1 hypothetical protein J4N45_10045 [Vibrio sp. SCSIO 43140]
MSDMAFVLDNVLDYQGDVSTTECPQCGSSAKERHSDSNIGGAINSIFSINCPHCGYHDCDKEECDVCEQTPCGAVHDNHRGYNEASLAESKLERLITRLADTSLVNAVDVTELKLMLTYEPCADWFDTFLCLNLRSPFTHIKSQLLDAKFSYNLERKILAAKTA